MQRNRKYSAWMGGAKLAESEMYDAQCVEAEEWLEDGMEMFTEGIGCSCCFKKCPIVCLTCLDFRPSWACTTDT